MKIIHIYQKKSDNNDNNSELSNKINEIKSSIKNQTPIFMLLHSENCGHCIKMLPNWRQLKHSDEIKEKRNHPFLIVDIEHKMIEKLKDEELNEDLKLDNIVGYPTIIQIHKGKIEPYEESDISLKDRSTDSFIEWIESKLEEHNIKEKNTTTETLDDAEEEYKTPKEYKTPEIILDDTEEETKKMEQKGGRKWSSKYKKSINY
jgi:thiol-disulfide isomerase/thioredoxin